jgi:hypothetical protein
MLFSHLALLTAMIVHHQRLGFESFTEEVEDVLKDHKQQQKVCAVMFLLLSVIPIRSDLTVKGSREESVKVGAVRQDGTRTV